MSGVGVGFVGAGHDGRSHMVKSCELDLTFTGTQKRYEPYFNLSGYSIPTSLRDVKTRTASTSIATESSEAGEYTHICMHAMGRRDPSCYTLRPFLSASYSVQPSPRKQRNRQNAIAKSTP